MNTDEPSIKHLYAAAAGGMRQQHGFARGQPLASNSLLEAMVFLLRSYRRWCRIE